MDERKVIKELSLREIESAIEHGLNSVTGTSCTVSINALELTNSNDFYGETFNINLTLKTPKRNSDGTLSSDYEEDDTPF